ncbi:ATP synthase subunit d, mitochondrial-like [Gadus morhua]|uniref:ATP synthase subunit d, mitochondrial-like n=1 Tax=Gadus morhua TaxID=8049 RepID=UPI0011B4C35D|nr:ATP synthase subunit d, mitochondrial-like [Gadus morhua]
MGVRRAALKAVDWVAFAERVPPNQRTMFNTLKTRSDALAAKLTSLPEKPVTIDRTYYRSAVAKAGMVEEFEKTFTALKVPEPVDTQSVLINSQEAEALEKFHNMIPFDQMTIERLEKQKYPYWPHKPIADL